MTKRNKAQVINVAPSPFLKTIASTKSHNCVLGTFHNHSTFLRKRVHPKNITFTM